MSIDPQAVESALVGMRTSLQADGYDLAVDAIDAGVAHLRIVAGPNACEECLVPKSLMVGMLRHSLRDLSEVTSIDLRYPLD